MSDKSDYIKQIRQDFQSLSEATSDFPDHVHSLRTQALDHFLKTGFPSGKDEDWRFTDLKTLLDREFHTPVEASPISVDYSEMQDSQIPDTLTFWVVNGQLQSYDSGTKDVRDKISIEPLNVAFRQSSNGTVKSMTANSSRFAHPFVTLNTALMQQGLIVRIPPETVLDQPLHFVYLTQPEGDNEARHLRILIDIGPHSDVTIIEHFIGISAKTYCNNYVSHYQVGENTSLKHTVIQEEAPQARHLYHLSMDQQRNSRVNSQHLTLGGRLSRGNATLTLQEGSEAVINGLSLSADQQEMDQYTIIDHAESHTTSREFFKNILHDHSHGIFNGRVIVRPNAQKSDADQKNKNLLLSKTALMNSNPQLEIFADDVKCAHGSTTGELDKDALFYLRSRGISPLQAQALLIEGFAREILDEVPVKTVQTYMESGVDRWLQRHGFKQLGD